MLFEKIRNAVLTTLDERTSDIKAYIERENLNIVFSYKMEFTNNAKVEMTIFVDKKGSIFSHNDSLEFIDSADFIASLNNKEKKVVSGLFNKVYILNDELRTMF